MIVIMGQIMRLREFASEVDETIAACVRSLSSGRNVQMSEVAAALNVPKATLYNKLNGTSPWKASEVASIAALFKVRISDLYDGLGGRVGPQPPSGPLAQLAELRTFNPKSPIGAVGNVVPLRPRAVPPEMALLMTS